MPEFIHRRWHGLHMILAFVLLAILTILLFLYHWLYLWVGGMAILGLAIYAWYAEKSFREDFIGYVATLTYRIRRAGDKVVQRTPVGMILFNEEGVVEWHNPFISELLQIPNFVSVPLLEVLPVLAGKLEEDGRHQITWRKQVLDVQVYAEERLLFVSDVTEFARLKERYQQEQVAIGIVQIDNLEEVSQGMDEKNHTLLLAEVTRTITDWAAEYSMFIPPDQRQVSRRHGSGAPAKAAGRSVSDYRSGTGDDAESTDSLYAEHRFRGGRQVRPGSGPDGFFQLGDCPWPRRRSGGGADR